MGFLDEEETLGLIHSLFSQWLGSENKGILGRMLELGYWSAIGGYINMLYTYTDSSIEWNCLLETVYTF
jgi:hypothetical protein